MSFDGWMSDVWAVSDSQTICPTSTILSSQSSSTQGINGYEKIYGERNGCGMHCYKAPQPFYLMFIFVCKWMLQFRINLVSYKGKIIWRSHKFYCTSLFKMYALWIMEVIHRKIIINDSTQLMEHLQMMINQWWMILYNTLEKDIIWEVSRDDSINCTRICMNWYISVMSLAIMLSSEILVVH